MNILITTVLILTVPALILFIVGLVSDNEGLIDASGSWLMIVGFVMLFVALIGREGSVQKYMRYEKKKGIVSVQDNQVTQGHISGGLFVFSGTVDGQAKYFYYEKTKEGGYVLKNINATQAVIYQDEDNNPYINYFIEARKSNKFWMIGENDLSYNVVDFHIPKGSIIREFNLDAK